MSHFKENLKKIKIDQGMYSGFRPLILKHLTNLKSVANLSD